METEKDAAPGPLGAAETLAGSVHNEIVTLLRAMDGAWSALPEARQEFFIERAEGLSRRLVTGSVLIVAADGFDHVPVQLTKFTADGAKIKGNYECPFDTGSLGMLGDHAGRKALVVFADPAAFLGSRDRPKADADEPPLPLDEDEDEGGDEDEEEDPPAPQYDTREERAMDGESAAAAAQRIWDEQDGTLRVPPAPDVPDGYTDAPPSPAAQSRRGARAAAH